MREVADPYYWFWASVFAALFGGPAAYVILRFAGRGWFHAKLKYQRTLINGLNEGARDDGKSTEK